MLMRATHSIRAIATHLGRALSTASREIARHTVDPIKGYDASLAGYRARLTQHQPRHPKLHPDGELFEVVAYLLRKYWPPQQIARTMKLMSPNDSRRKVSQEAIYNALYVMPRGSLKMKLTTCLRRSNSKHWPRSRSKDRRQKIPDLVSIHMLPPEIEDRLMPGHREGDLIIGANNRSAVGKLV